MGEILRLTKGDYGIGITYTVRDANGTARDISAATSIKIRIGRYGEANSFIEGTMAFVTDGTNGQVQYTILNTDLVTTGYYDAEIRITEASSVLTTRCFTLHIVNNLNAEAT